MGFLLNKYFGKGLFKKEMVHKKYIKRDGKVFGPYYYENYRENGVIKTRYIGKKHNKKVWVNQKKKEKRSKVSRRV